MHASSTTEFQQRNAAITATRHAPPLSERRAMAAASRPTPATTTPLFPIRHTNNATNTVLTTSSHFGAATLRRASSTSPKVTRPRAYYSTVRASMPLVPVPSTASPSEYTVPYSTVVRYGKRHPACAEPLRQLAGGVGGHAAREDKYPQ